MPEGLRVCLEGRSEHGGGLSTCISPAGLLQCLATRSTGGGELIGRGEWRDFLSITGGGLRGSTLGEALLLSTHGLGNIDELGDLLLTKLWGGLTTKLSANNSFSIDVCLAPKLFKKKLFLSAELGLTF